MPEHVMTLIAGSGHGLLANSVVAVRAAMTRLGADVLPPDWLADDIACDLVFDHLNPDQADAAARRKLGSEPIDVIAQPMADRQKKLLVADMESTLIRNEMLDELADYIGLKKQVAAITARAMNGELDFAGAIEARVSLLKGMPVETLEAAATRIEIMPGAAALIATMRENGAMTTLVSGGFTFYTAKICKQLGIDADFANTLEIKDGVLTGKVRYPILGREAKFETLVRLAAEAGLPLSATLTVGDGANDLDMILAAGLGVAFHPKARFGPRAPSGGWIIATSPLCSTPRDIAAIRSRIADALTPRQETLQAPGRSPHKRSR